MKLWQSERKLGGFQTVSRKNRMKTYQKLVEMIFSAFFLQITGFKFLSEYQKFCEQKKAVIIVIFVILLISNKLHANKI